MKYSRKSIIFLSYADGIPLVSWCQVLYMENSRGSIIFLSYIDGIHYHNSLFKSLYFCIPIGTGYTHTRIIILFYYSHSSSHMNRFLIYFLTPTLTGIHREQELNSLMSNVCLVHGRSSVNTGEAIAQASSCLRILIVCYVRRKWDILLKNSMSHWAAEWLHPVQNRKQVESCL